MERAQNSDSETHVEMLDWTFGSDLSGKALCCIFFGTPCTNTNTQPILLSHTETNTNTNTRAILLSRTETN